MKKLIYFFVMAITIASCSKDMQKEEQATDNQSQIKLVTFSDGIKTSITLLEFTDKDHYESTISLLESEIESLEDAFVSEWSTLSDDDLNTKEEEVGFNEQQPLIDFENSYNIPLTLRQIFVNAEEQWLDNEELVDANSPSLTYPFSLAELTLLNPDGMVKIGNDILQLTKNGFIQISDLDIPTVIRIKNGDMTALDEPTVTFNLDGDDGGKGECTSWKSNNYPDPYAYKKKVIKHVHFHSYPWKGTGSSKITSYKKSGSKWKKYRMNLGVAVQSYFKDTNCGSTVAQGWSGWKRKKRKSIEKNFSSWGAFPQYRAKKNQSIFGYYEYASHSNSKVLTW